MSNINNEQLTPMNGCAYCGISMNNHGDRLSSEHGLHMWVAPANAQRKERLVVIINNHKNKSS